MILPLVFGVGGDNAIGMPTPEKGRKSFLREGFVGNDDVWQ